MRTTFRTTIAVGGVAIGAIALSGCGVLPAHEVNDKATLTDTVKSVHLDVPSGSVALRGEAGATAVTIEREIRFWGTKRDVGESYTISGDELVLRGCGRNCTVDYTILLPADVDVSGQTSNGEIELTAVNNVDVSTSNGAISLEEVTGRIKATTDNGAIEASELRSSGITAKTENGRIELELETAQNVRASASNGSITVRVPTGSFAVSAETDIGSKNIEIAHDPQGSFALDLATSTGSITVTDSASPRE
jgi:hypothetical protein